jgi:hypothetical protein
MANERSNPKEVHLNLGPGNHRVVIHGNVDHVDVRSQGPAAPSTPPVHRVSPPDNRSLWEIAQDIDAESEIRWGPLGIG